MIKLTAQHPTFQRLALQIDARVRADREKLTLALLKMDPPLVTNPMALEHQLDQSCQALCRRLARENGLMGRYVAH